MAGIDIGKGLKGLFSGASNVVDGAVKTAVNAAKDMKLPEVKLPDVPLPEINLGQLTDVFTNKSAKDAAEVHRSLLCALQVFYYMIAVDGQILDDELEMFDSIGRELDPRYEMDRESILAACRQQLEKAMDDEDHYDVIRDGVEEALAQYSGAKQQAIAPKLLLWDLLTLAYSDGDYPDAERRMIKYVARKLNIDKAVVLEMESSMLTIQDLDRELQWIKSTDRPYQTIEIMVNEIENRKKNVFDSVMDLVQL